MIFLINIISSRIFFNNNIILFFIFIKLVFIKLVFIKLIFNKLCLW